MPFDARPEVDALEPSEYTLLSRLHRISMWLAKERRKAVVELVQAEYELDALEAERWVRKAEDYMALGVVESADRARQMYHYRLSRIHDLAMANAVRDQVEVISKPTRLIKDDDGKEVVRTVQHTKVKHQILDTGALQVALKSAREMAHISGARPVDSRFGRNVNIQINNNGKPGELPSAQVTSQLANEHLAAMLGARVVAEQDPKGRVAVLPERLQDDPGPADGPDQAPPAPSDGGRGA